jgi:hypothetical protein
VEILLVPATRGAHLESRCLNKTRQAGSRSRGHACEPQRDDRGAAQRRGALFDGGQVEIVAQSEVVFAAYMIRRREVHVVSHRSSTRWAAGLVEMVRMTRACVTDGRGTVLRGPAVDCDAEIIHSANECRITAKCRIMRVEGMSAGAGTTSRETLSNVCPVTLRLPLAIDRLVPRRYYPVVARSQPVDAGLVPLDSLERSSTSRWPPYSVSPVQGEWSADWAVEVLPVTSPSVVS